MTEREPPIDVMELVGMHGEAHTVAKTAMGMRRRAEEMLAEANNLFADVEALERGARLLAARKD